MRAFSDDPRLAPRRRRVRARHRAAGAPLALRLLRATLAAGIALLLGTLGAGASLAALSDTATASGGTIRAGTATLAVPGGTLSLVPLYPTASRNASFTVTNTGDVPLQLRGDLLERTSAANALATSLTVGIRDVTSSGTCPASTAVTPHWSSTLATASVAPAAALPTNLAPGATATLCLTSTLAGSVAQGAQGSTVAFRVTIGGVQS